jgi:hypothetical protein
VRLGLLFNINISTRKNGMFRAIFAQVCAMISLSSKARLTRVMCVGYRSSQER